MSYCINNGLLNFHFEKSRGFKIEYFREIKYFYRKRHDFRRAIVNHCQQVKYDLKWRSVQ